MAIFNLWSKKKEKNLVELVSKVQLVDFFKEGFPLNSNVQEELARQANDGKAFFDSWNESRIQLAFDSFDESMKHALFEILYLLHINDPSFKNWKFDGYNNKTHKKEEQEFNLYVEDSPCGVKAISKISSIFKEEFEAYIETVFQSPKLTEPDNPAIEGLFSIGSIGTIGHKAIDSDLDLEVQYNLHAFTYEVSSWTDQLISECLNHEFHLWVSKICKLKKYSEKTFTQNAELKKFVIQKAKKQLQKNYPYLFDHFIAKSRDYTKILEQSQNTKLHSKIILEILSVFRRNTFKDSLAITKYKEELLKKKIQKIQDYIAKKFPEAEIYLFPFSVTDFRKGVFSSTLDSKESSGSAYELILNYETLMPGIYFTPVIPTHFLFSEAVNNDPMKLEKIVTYMRFGLMPSYSFLEQDITHQGHTQDLDTQYVANHEGAIYWEAFKGSSGNLPKATLNLLRYEMLLEKNCNKTIIQLIKNPTFLDPFVTSIAKQGWSSNLFHDEADFTFSVNGVLDLEKEFPLLLRDPWWLRYKALKIGFTNSECVKGIQHPEREKISKIIDLAFALHLRVSDVITTPGQRQVFERHREKVLQRFLEEAFPENNKARTQLINIFVGEVETVNKFESELRRIFTTSIERVSQKIVKMGLKTKEQDSKEFEIWLHYYIENFVPSPNVVQKTILSHLKIPRGRLQVGYKKKQGWFFKALQKESGIGKRFDTFGILNYLPNEINLIEKTGFLHGLAYCVLNNYYGIIHRGTLRESQTALEFDAKHMDLGNHLDNRYAFIQPSQVENFMRLLLELFPKQKINYLDCVYSHRRITEVIVFLNLWKFGRVSFLYRDNLGTIFVDEYDMPEYVKHYHELVKSAKNMLRYKVLHKTIRKFFADKKIEFDAIKFQTWVNPHSIEIVHQGGKLQQREDELSRQLLSICTEQYSENIIILD
ncbi:MAG: hypothetical protein ACI86H_000555 [bacterium]|jgi:hypothetical protein